MRVASCGGIIKTYDIMTKGETNWNLLREVYLELDICLEAVLRLPNAPWQVPRG